MKRTPRLIPLAAVAAVVAVLLYWRHWIHEQRKIDKTEARALIVKRTAKRTRATHQVVQHLFCKTLQFGFAGMTDFRV